MKRRRGLLVIATALALALAPHPREGDGRHFMVVAPEAHQMDARA